MIYIVRHGQTDYNLEKRITGRIDIPLNETGKIEAMLLQKELEGISFDYVFASPLSRALETAKIITNQEIIIDDRLIERSNGLIEGKCVKDLEDFDYTNHDYQLESIKDVRKRINSFLDEITKKYPKKSILVVTHGGVIINIRYYFEGEPKGDYDEYIVKNCDILKYPNKKRYSHSCGYLLT